MALFSQRKGIRPLEKAFQRESIDDELRNCLWNALKLNIWDHWGIFDSFDPRSLEKIEVEKIVEEIWIHYFKKPLDTIPKFFDVHPESSLKIIREYFFNAEWWELYDFVEFLIKASPSDWKGPLRHAVNYFLTAENSAYRIIEDEIVEITDENEIGAVETALEKTNRNIQSHLSTALSLLSDRKSPDYRNSIKESISAVEAICQSISGKPKASLGDCISVIKKSDMMHTAFEQALLKLYGYSSNEGGIRHALTEESVSPSFADAKFMLVTCSAFVNFLWTKASELGIRIEN